MFAGRKQDGLPACEKIFCLFTPGALGRQDGWPDGRAKVGVAAPGFGERGPARGRTLDIQSRLAEPRLAETVAFFGQKRFHLKSLDK